ncbi:DUF6702 family protein [Winogradskyella sp. 3972H.M.0a.05]|uniref:DUF6702 family protein n=1 Tax=Winogradskyella sp. 3972H.M.0a.05 TaxID=2950277 RepID=UPI003398A133
MKLLTYMALLVSFFMVRYSAVAHNPNEVNYNIVVNDEKQELVVHFTPMTAIQLLKVLEPKLKDAKLIKLENYLDTFETYFNETIIFSIDSNTIEFDLIDSDLNKHDATLTFHLDLVLMESPSYEITVNSFTEIYKRLQNVVTIELDGKQSNCILSESSTHCSSDKTVIAKSNSSLSIYYMPLILIALGIIGFAYFKKKQINID